ncbi:hypothetical protein A0H81_13413 [Grifola frondosa]|uniref:EF-hand domain-containing protein n=1 Tax=Grifola frondosa TaxID=5627 RepID=A0A1C7LPA8_GRIFR|nr:hypothetical protein A0H81_13413 [Grifola frondosa]
MPELICFHPTAQRSPQRDPTSVIAQLSGSSYRRQVMSSGNHPLSMRLSITADVDPFSRRRIQQSDSRDPVALHTEQTSRSFALSELNAIDKLISDAALKSKASNDASDKKGNKDIAAKIIKGISHVLEVAESVAEIQPMAAGVVRTFSKMLSLELQRRENNEQIAVVYHSMTHLVYTLRHLEPILDIEDDIGDDLSYALADIQTSMEEFGRFVNLYYKCRQKIFHVLFSQQYKDEMSGYLGQFNQQKKKLESLINTRVTITTHARLDMLIQHSETIINKLNEGDTKVQAAADFIEAHGGPDTVKRDDALLAELAKTLNEKLTTSIKLTLREDFSVLLEESAKQYALKMDNVQVAIAASVSSAQEVILRRLNEGPHEMIVDEDIRAVWKQNATGRLASNVGFSWMALRDYYQRKFDGHRTTETVHHNDYWTLQFLSKVIYHSAIGDVIDEDGSGFISASELNHFVERRPKDWSVPQWFAFWACGWYNNNISYHRGIHKTLNNIYGAIRESSSPPEIKDGFSKLLDHIKPLVLSADVDEDGWDECDKLVQLQDRYMEIEEGGVKRQLQQFGFNLEDESTLSSVMNDSRIELHIMCLLYVLMEQLHTTMSQLLDEIDDNDALAQKTFEGLSSSFLATFYAFDERMHDLVRCWRQQGKDIDLQIDRYADGLFVNWYKEAEEENNALHRLKAFLGDGDEDSHESESTNAVDSQQAKIEYLVRQASSFEDRLTSIENLLRRLVVHGENGQFAAM